MKKIISVLLVCELISFAHFEFAGHDLCSRSCFVAAAEKTAAGKAEKKQEAGEDNGSLKEIICPFKYLVFFFWYSFVIIGGAVVFVADISFGFSKKLTKKYMKKVDRRTRKIEAFFRRFGCT